MDIQKIEKRLKKINTLLSAFNEDSKISSIEKDLMLGYVRELYELILDSESEVVHQKAHHAKEQIIEKPIVVPKEIVVEKIVEKVVEIPQIKQEKIEQPVVEKIAEPVITIKEEKKVEVNIEEPKVQSIPIIDHSHTTISPELQAIFIKEEITDLADKLSMMKINDIGQSIGINSRLVMINELFNGDGNFFNKTIKKLNECNSFEEAKHILIDEVAIPMNWEKEDKLKDAQQLVKLVMRKFS